MWSQGCRGLEGSCPECEGALECESERGNVAGSPQARVLCAALGRSGCGGSASPDAAPEHSSPGLPTSACPCLGPSIGLSDLLLAAPTRLRETLFRLPALAGRQPPPARPVPSRLRSPEGSACKVTVGNLMDDRAKQINERFCVQCSSARLGLKKEKGFQKGRAWLVAGPRWAGLRQDGGPPATGHWPWRVGRRPSHLAVHFICPGHVRLRL